MKAAGNMIKDQVTHEMVKDAFYENTQTTNFYLYKSRKALEILDAMTEPLEKSES